MGKKREVFSIKWRIRMGWISSKGQGGRCTYSFTAAAIAIMSLSGTSYRKNWLFQFFLFSTSYLLLPFPSFSSSVKHPATTFSLVFVFGTMQERCKRAQTCFGITYLNRTGTSLESPLQTSKMWNLMKSIFDNNVNHQIWRLKECILIARLQHLLCRCCESNWYTTIVSTFLMFKGVLWRLCFIATWNLYDKK